MAKILREKRETGSPYEAWFLEQHKGRYRIRPEPERWLKAPTPSPTSGTFSFAFSSTIQPSFTSSLILVQKVRTGRRVLDDLVHLVERIELERRSYGIREGSIEGNLHRAEQSKKILE